MKTAGGIAGWFRTLTSAEKAASHFTLAFLLTYSVMPIVVAALLPIESYFGDLARIAAVGGVFVLLGSRCRWMDRAFTGRNPRISVDGRFLVYTVWSVFIVFVLMLWVTAPAVPAAAALAGADPSQLAEMREMFLKARTGFEASFVYINSFITGALLPYCIAWMFVHSIRGRWSLVIFFFIYALSFIEKAFFLKAFFPLLFLFSQGFINSRLSLRSMAAIGIVLLSIVTLLSGSGNVGAEGSEEFFSVGFIPTTGVEHLLWRSVAIPMLTAADAFRVFYSEFGGTYLYGATSSVLAALTGVPRIEFERLVFAAQWGQNELGTGSANSTFVIEAFIDFGYLGVALFGWVIGLIFRSFNLTRDRAYQAMWMLFGFGIYNSGLIGIFLSNGFILLIMIGIFFNIRGPAFKKEMKSVSLHADCGDGGSGHLR
jgi:hypothetical protein